MADRAGFALTNMSLNKIAYFAHAWYMAQYSEPLLKIRRQNTSTVYL